MRSRRWTFFLLCIALMLVGVTVLWRSRLPVTAPIEPTPPKIATPASGTPPAPSSPAVARDTRHVLNGTVEEAWAALAPIEAHLLANEDPDTFVDDVMALEKVIHRLPYGALGTLVRTAHRRIDPKIADWLLPVLSIAVGRAGFNNVDALLRERIADEGPKTLWGLVAGLAVRPALAVPPHRFIEGEEKKFWLYLFLAEPMIRDTGYEERFKKRIGYEENPFGISEPVALPPEGGGPFDGKVYDWDLPPLLDRIERIPKGDLVAEQLILGMLTQWPCDEMSARAAKWAEDRGMLTSFRVWGIEDLGNRDLNQALALTRERIAVADEDPAFLIGMVEWLSGRSGSGKVFVPEPDILLFDAYYMQKANGTLMPRLIYYAVWTPRPEAVRVAEDVLSSPPNEEAHLSVLNALGDAMWSRTRAMKSGWQSLLMAVSRSPYERVRQGAAVMIARRAEEGWLTDIQAVKTRLNEMAEQDPSEKVRQSARHMLDELASKSGK